MDVAAFLDRVRRQPFYDEQLEHVEILPERPGQYARPERPLPAALEDLLKARGIEQLYTHQVATLELARKNRDAVVVTGTASGKTLCYNLPILEAVLSDPDTRALYLFPTKALAQDQLKGLLELLSGETAESPGRANLLSPSPRRRRKAAASHPLALPLDLDLTGVTLPGSASPLAEITAGVYDGDTPTAQRRRIRGEANLVLSNPDMLHASILPYHPKWARFFSRAAVHRARRSAHVPRHSRRARVCRAAAADAGLRALRLASRCFWPPAPRSPTPAS